jgi:hypothetical protein
VQTSPDPESFSRSYPLYMNIAVQYIRPKQLTYVRESFQAIIRDVVEQDDLDLETDPVVVRLVLSWRVAFLACLSFIAHVSTSKK